jgi:drug/metabolite transporter (DMT)-like permease
MFMMLGGMLVPFFYGILFLNEEISVGKIIGSILVTLCIVLQALWQKSDPTENNADNNANNKGKKYLFFALCICIFFINGTVCIISKSHAMSTGTVPETSFTFLSCLLTVVLSAIFLGGTLITKRDEKLPAVHTVLKAKPIAFASLIGCAAYVGNFLLLVAANHVPASVQFPLISGGTIALSAIVSFAFFKEKLSAKEWISIVGAFACTFLFVF